MIAGGYLLELVMETNNQKNKFKSTLNKDLPVL